MNGIVLICLVLLGSFQTIAQRDPTATLGNIKYEKIDGKWMSRTTIGAILANPRVSPNLDSCKILKYEVFITPTGGDEMVDWILRPG